MAGLVIVTAWLPVMALVMSLVMPLGQVAAAESSSISVSVLARIGDDVITRQAYLDQYHAAVRQRFYHRQPPQADLAIFRRKLLQDMIDRVLLRRAVARRGIVADERKVKSRMAQVTARYANSVFWKKSGASLSRELHNALALDDQIGKLRQQIEQQVRDPDERGLRAYYQQHLGRFTTPPRLRVSMILLKVAPWAKSSAWAAAGNTAARLRQALADGADFAVLARRYSDDPSAEFGGDLGYIHKGMLSRAAEVIIDALNVGENSPPARLLRGYALFRLEERQPAQLNPFSKVAVRVGKMWQREQKKRAWAYYVSDLSAHARIDIDQAVLVDLD